MGQYTLIAFSFIFIYSFFYNNKNIYLGILFGTLGVFTGYGSPTYNIWLINYIITEEEI